MTDKELAHKINEDIVKHLEEAIIAIEVANVVRPLRGGTPMGPELGRLRALRTEYLGKVRVSAAELQEERRRREVRDAKNDTFFEALFKKFEDVRVSIAEKKHECPHCRGEH